MVNILPLPVGTRVKLRIKKYKRDGRVAPEQPFTKHDVGTIIPNGYVSWDKAHTGLYPYREHSNCWCISAKYLREVKGV